MGAAYQNPDKLSDTYPRSPGRGCVARLHYQIQHWAAFWIKLEGADLTPYATVRFDVRADQQPQVPGQIKIELKRANQHETSIAYLSGITTDWQTRRVKLSDFVAAGPGSPLSSLAQMEELVFTFEADRSGSEGIVYLDNIVFE